MPGCWFLILQGVDYDAFTYCFAIYRINLIRINSNDWFSLFAKGGVEMKYLLIVLLLLSGCATTVTPMDWSKLPPSDFPKLEIKVIKVTEDQLKERCKNIYYSPFTQPLACSLLYFSANSCLIYTATDNPEIIEHEKGHCQGYDHPNDASIRGGWERWKAKNKGS